MNIDRALKLKVGQIVTYPADRGTPGGTSGILHVGQNTNKAHNGVKYIWITLKAGGVWPSNRLS